MSTSQSSHQLRFRHNFNYSEDRSPSRIPAPSHRHAAPSAPWPWIDLEDEVDAVQLTSPLPPVPPPCDHVDCAPCWTGYPQSRFPNWTPAQVERSKIKRAIIEYNKNVPCRIHHVDVDINGLFTDPGKITAYENDQETTWNIISQSERPDNIRVRALFVEHMSGPVLQMLGARFNIEPFFFSSSLNWIPSRYQEEVKSNEGDHITITLTFIRSTNASTERPRTNSTYGYNTSTNVVCRDTAANLEHMIDTQAPLVLHSSNRMLVLDLLAVHLIRNHSGNTIISFHPDFDRPTTTACYLHDRIRFAGRSVYWQSIFQKSRDPTFVLLTFIWHAMYAWDEALENLYTHICWLEARVIETSDMLLTQELHVIRAHHLHYDSLLDDFRKTVVFVRDTRNPAMDSLPEAERVFSRELMERECSNLLNEIQRLQMSRTMQEKRLKNVINLVFSSVNINDSKRMKQMTEAAVRDSAAMRQIAYLSMVFLPGSFAAAIFGMNISEITPDTYGSLSHYFATAIPLTLVTIWVVVAFQSRYIYEDENAATWRRLGWPILLLRRWREKHDEDSDMQER